MTRKSRTNETIDLSCSRSWAATLVENALYRRILTRGELLDTMADLVDSGIRDAEGVSNEPAWHAIIDGGVAHLLTTGRAVQIGDRYALPGATVDTTTRTGYVYVLANDPAWRAETHVKIGLSINPKGRMKTFLTSDPGARYLLLLPVTDYRDVEAHLHRVFADRRVGGEWFEPVTVAEVRAATVAYLKGSAG